MPEIEQTREREKYKEVPQETYNEMTLEQLQNSRRMCEIRIQIVRANSDDPRAPKALTLYQEEKAKIVRAIKAHNKQQREVNGKPPKETIGVQALSLSGKRH